MELLVAGLLVILGSGALALLLGLVRADRLAIAASTLGAVAGGAIAAIPALDVLAGAPPVHAAFAWESIPRLSSLSIHVDRIASVFLVTILGIGAAASVYGAGYLDHYRGKPQRAP